MKIKGIINKIEKHINISNKDISYVLLIIFIFSIAIFFIGFHNIDYSVNIGRIVEHYNLDVMEMNTNYEIWSLDEVYIHGLRQMLISVVGFSVSFILLFIIYMDELLNKCSH